MRARHWFIWASAAAAGGMAGFGSSPGAHAAIIPVASRAGLNADVGLDWSAFGPAGTAISTYAATTAGPLTININTASGILFRHDEGTDFTGIFAPGDALLSQSPGDLSDAVLVGFSAPVSGVGAQLQALPGGAFTGILDLYSAADTLLGEVTAAGDNTGAEDGSAPFLGALSTTADISFVVFSAGRGNPSFPKEGDVAINALSVVAPVPEPASVLLLGPALLGLLGIARKRAGPR